MTVYTHPNIDAGTKIHNYWEFKDAYPHLLDLGEETLKLKDEKMILEQNSYYIDNTACILIILYDTAWNTLGWHTLGDHKW